MDNPEFSPNADPTSTERRENRVVDLHLDRVVASQPEIGPTPPDGGYGWLIVISAIIYHITVPALLSMYGLIILKAHREEGIENEVLRIWDVDVALVPVIMVVIRLLMESWCRAMVKVFNMPRFMALSGLCLTVAGVLLSSFSTDANSNDHIVNIFAGLFAGIGCALTGQQTEVIITHFFRDKLTIAQRLVRIAPSVGNCLVPILIGYLSKIHTSYVVVKIYGAILMQNCLFLASYARPVYIEKVRRSYSVLRDHGAEDDIDDDIIFTNQRRSNVRVAPNTTQISDATTQDDDNDIIVYDSNKKRAKEVIDVEVRTESERTNNEARFSKEVIDVEVRTERGRTNSEARFSSNFNPTFAEDPSPSNNRFSSDFGSIDIRNYARDRGYRELEHIEASGGQNPQPLYRETTVNAPQGSPIFTPDMTAGSVRRTASLKKNFITVVNMLRDVNFYLYSLLHLNTTFSILVLGVVFPPLVWNQNLSMNTWSVSLMIGVANGAALCFILLCIALPKSLNEKARLCAAFCVVGAAGFFGITLSSNKSFLAIWCMFASFSTAASSLLQQPLYNSTFNEFDATASITTPNAIVAIFIMVWSLAHNYTYKSCFLTASCLQTATAVVFFLGSFRRRRF